MESSSLAVGFQGCVHFRKESRKRLAVSEKVAVVVNEDWNAEEFFEIGPEGYAAPERGEIDQVADDPSFVIRRTGKSETDGLRRGWKHVPDRSETAGQGIQAKVQVIGYGGYFYGSHNLTVALHRGEDETGPSGVQGQDNPFVVIVHYVVVGCLSYACLYGLAGLSCRRPGGGYRVFSCRGGDDEGLGIMDCEWLESAVRTLHDGFFAFAKVEDVDAAFRVVQDGTVEGVPAGLDEFKAVQSGALFLDAFFFAKDFEPVAELRHHERSRPLPLDDLLSPFHVDGTRFSVQSESVPVPELEGKNVGRGADFEHHGVASRAVDCSARYQEMVVPVRGKIVHIFIGRE